VAAAVDVESAITQIKEETAAVVLVPPLGVPSSTEAIHMLASVLGASDAPEIFVVFPRRPSDPDARLLYLEGAAGVFEWPCDSQVLLRIALDLIESKEAAEHPRGALARVVRERLGNVATKRPPRRLRVRVRGGIARLSGRVDSLWARLKLAERVTQTPGIEQVVVEEVHVERCGRTDCEIAKSIRSLLRGAAGIEHRTLAVAVHDGHVSVLGWADGPEEKARISELIGLTEGVRGVDNRTEIDADAKHRDTTRARAWEAEIREHFAALDVDVAVVKGIAVLSGRVPRLSVKLGIQRRLDVGLVDRIVNRIEVERPR